MTGPEHYVKAEMLLSAAEMAADEDEDQQTEAVLLARAQVHATLALAAATAANDPDPSGDGQPAGVRNQWREVAFPGTGGKP